MPWTWNVFDDHLDYYQKSGGAVAATYLLMEDADFLLQEDGTKIILN
jgi:hypothetical protein